MCCKERPSRTISPCVPAMALSPRLPACATGASDQASLHQHAMLVFFCSNDCAAGRRRPALAPLSSSGTGIAGDHQQPMRYVLRHPGRARPGPEARKESGCQQPAATATTTQFRRHTHQVSDGPRT